MGIVSVTDLGKQIIATKRILKAVSTNPLAVECRMQVISAVSGTVYDASNAPDLGTSDEFTFEINHFLFRQFYNTQFPLSTDNINDRFDLKAFRILFSDIEADGTESATYFATQVSGDFTQGINFSHNITQRPNKLNSFNVDNYYCDNSGSATSKFLTSAPSPVNVWLNDKNYISVLKWSKNGLDVVQQQYVIEEYDVNNALLTTVKTTFLNRDEGGIKIPFHNNMVVEITNVLTSYALIYVEDIVGLVKRSEIRRYNVVTNCGNVKIEWINEFGKTDHFYLKGEQIKGISTNTSVYEKATPINPSNNDYGNRVFNNELSENWTLYTDTVSQTVVDWLANIYLSKKVSVYIDGERFPVILNSNKLVYFSDINGIYQISIPIIFSNNVLGNN
tara:strand:- start:8383 stop:9555 length:1173 start_codon:yes stop_codon:yes gene_type:complete